MLVLKTMVVIFPVYMVFGVTFCALEQIFFSFLPNNKKKELKTQAFGSLLVELIQLSLLLSMQEEDLCLF